MKRRERRNVMHAGACSDCMEGSKVAKGSRRVGRVTSGV